MISETKKIQEYYQALVDRDSQYIGSFYVGVKTTSVFCISTCRARKPKKENVVFYTTVNEALQNGFRPCKVCKPTENVDEPPLEIKELMDRVSRNPEKKITDDEIKKLGYNPEKTRRWFKNHMNITFQAYQRMIRMNTAYENLRQGTRVTNSAFDLGYESLSGFGHTFKSLYNESPGNAHKLNLININRYTTPIGPMYACATEKGVCLLEFTDRKALETELNDLTVKLKGMIVIGKNHHLQTLEQQLKEYFEGKRHDFDIPLDTPGTVFQQKIWQQLLTIQYGKTRSYKEQAIAIGKPSAIRAVAGANGQNRISIIIPCHRVIGSDGSLTGYGGGLPRKKWLLAHESENSQ